MPDAGWSLGVAMLLLFAAFAAVAIRGRRDHETWGGVTRAERERNDDG
jgi:hypothetical protein